MDPISSRLARLAPADLPLPEPEGLVRAVQPQPRRWASGLASAYLPLTAFGLVSLVIGAIGGWLWLAVLGFLAAVTADLAAAHARAAVAQLLALSGWDQRVRALVRELLFVTVLARTTPGLTGWFLLAMAALHLGWLGFGAITTAMAVRQPMLAYRPGAARQPAATVAYASAYATATGAPFGWAEIVAAPLAMLGAGVAGAVGYALLTAAVVGVIAVQLVRVRRIGRQSAPQEEQLAAELTAPAPLAVVHVSAGVAQAKHLLGQWLPTLEALGGVVIIVREASQLAVIGATALPVVYAPSNRSLERAVPPSARVAFYLSNSGKSVDLLRDHRLRHVFLGHGDSDKATSATPLARMYDQIWVAGEVAIDRYRAAGVELPRERFVVVGRPQVESLRVGPLQQQPPTVLYAPTFEGYYEQTNYASLETMGPALIRNLLAHPAGVRIIFKPHPSTGLHRPGMRAARAEVNRLLRQAGDRNRCLDDEPTLTLHEAFDAADVLLSDVSSVVSDFLYTGRPILVTNPKAYPPAEFRDRFPGLAGGYLVTDPAEAAPLLSDALGADPLRARRAEAAVNVLGDHPHGPTRSFIDAARRLAGLAAEDSP